VNDSDGFGETVTTVSHAIDQATGEDRASICFENDEGNWFEAVYASGKGRGCIEYFDYFIKLTDVIDTIRETLYGFTEQTEDSSQDL